MLSIVTITSGFVGCVMPPDADYVPAQGNQPPRILNLTASPPPYEGVVYQSPTCAAAAQTYGVYVRDPDLGDVLYWRAFVDYGRHWPQDFSSGEMPNEDKDLNISFPVPNNDLRFDGLSDEPHMVELIVADRPFYTDDRPPRGHAVDTTGGALTDSIIWTVKYSAVKCGP